MLEPFNELLRGPRPDPQRLLLQAAARRAVLAAALESARSAESPIALANVLAGLAAHLVELELHDDGARMRALSRAVAADFERLDQEATELELRAAPVVVPK